MRLLCYSGSAHGDPFSQSLATRQTFSERFAAQLCCSSNNKPCLGQGWEIKEENYQTKWEAVEAAPSNFDSLPNLPAVVNVSVL